MMNIRAIAAVGLLAIALPSVHAAGQQAKAGKKAQKSAWLKYDADSSGIIDPDEAEAMKKAFTTDTKLKQYDTNKGGKLDDDEIAAIQSHKQKKKSKSA